MASLSPGALKLLRYLQTLGQRVYEVPAKLAALFPGDAQACEAAQVELEQLGFIDLVPGLPDHIPRDNDIRGAAITLAGQRHLATLGG